MALCNASLAQRGVLKYMGQWRDDLQTGEGKCLYADGSAYDGEWKGGKRRVLRPRASRKI
jgi:hypothetical protein